MAQKQDILIRNITVLDGTGGAPLSNASVLISGGRFENISVGEVLEGGAAQEIDGSGKTLIPGLVDMHAHLLSGGFDTLTQYIDSFDSQTERKALAQMLYWGVTTVCNPVQPLETTAELRKYEKENGDRSPRLFLSGPGFTAPGGWAGSLLPIARKEPADEASAEAFVNELADASVDFLKIYYDAQCCAFVSPLPRLDKAVMKRIIKQAHARNVKVMVHAYDNQNHIDSLKAGADMMAHSAVTGPVDNEYIDLALSNRTLYLATLSVYRDAFDEQSLRKFISQDAVQQNVPRRALDTLAEGGPLDGFLQSVKQDYLKGQLPVIQKNLRTVYESGVQIAAGPDTGVMGAFPGLSVHREMELMVEAGVPASAVLKAATSGSARFLGMKSNGQIKEGNVADAVLISGNPEKDITATRNIASVIKDGVLVDREALRQDFLNV